MSFLLIVESPTKIKSLKKHIPEAEFTSSYGHIRDLPENKLAVDPDNDFETEYQILEGKEDVAKTIEKLAKKCKTVYLATDPDREGEAIAWHIAHLIPAGCKIQRITFNAITKSAVMAGLAHPRDVDMNLVNAQQARRILDRLVGYKLSPIVQRKVQKGTSAGRVQSVALLLVVQRERAIEAFIPVEFWSLNGVFSNNKDSFEARLHAIDGKTVVRDESEHKQGVRISSEKEAAHLLEIARKAHYKVSEVERKEKLRHSSAPFTTSTLQQDASRTYGFNPSRAMKIAQKLYEGVQIHSRGGFEGLITYMRTDSTRVAPEAIDAVRDHIQTTYGKEFLPEKPNFFKSKADSQDAHEAIRPTNLDLPPEQIRNDLTIEEFKLYQLIWRRFIASQMKPAVYDSQSYDIESENGKLTFRATGSTLKFKGFLAVYDTKDEEESSPDAEKLLPSLDAGTSVHLDNLDAAQGFTKPPARFTEASLIKELERSGIGRPSTYASIMNKILSREYTTKEKLTLVPTELGKITVDVLVANFPEIIDIGFTAKMEEELDLIADGKVDWKKFLHDFWKSFAPLVEKATKEATIPKVETEIDCPECGKKLLKIWAGSRGGGKYFYGCSGYPDCSYRTSIELFHFDRSAYASDFNFEQTCPKCDKPMSLRIGKFGAFLGCSGYPDCKTIINIPKEGEVALPKTPCPAEGCPGDLVQRKSRFGKSFFSCSTYPECDVIGNSVEEVLLKFKDHPRTAAPARKSKAKPAAKKKSTAKKTKEAPKKEKTKRKSPEFTPSKELAAIIGPNPLSRGDATKALWDYIKTHKLQNEANKRQILPDAKLKKILGDEPIDMMKLAGHLSKHLT